jgi:hypothetical protein
VGTMPVPEEKCQGCGIIYARTISHRQDCPVLRSFHEEQDRVQAALQPLADAVNYKLKPGESFVPQAELDEVMRKACTPSFDHIKKAKAGKP